MSPARAFLTLHAEHTSAAICCAKLAAACRQRPDDPALAEAYAEARAAEDATGAALRRAVRQVLAAFPEGPSCNAC